MLRALISFVVVAVTVVFQLTVVDRIAFPGGSGPDLVLIAVAALALASGPMTGSLTGFLGGLALDVAPPGSHFVGQDALVFCLIGYACGLLADQSSGDGAPEAGHTAFFEIVVTAAGTICGEALAALLGVMLSDPRVTWSAITHVLPVAVAYDVLLCPFVLYAAAAALRLAGAQGEGQRVAWSPARTGTPVPGTGLGALRQTGANTPRLRLSEHGNAGRGSAGRGSVGRGSLHVPGAGGRPMAKREPQLRLGHGSLGHGSLARVGSAGAGLGTAFSGGGLGGGPAKVKFGSRRREGPIRGGIGSSGSASRTTAFSTSAFSSSSLGRSWLGGSVFSRSSSSLGRSSTAGPPAIMGRSSAVFGRSAPLGLSSPFRHRGNAMRSPGGLGGHGRNSAVGRLTGALRPGQRKSPGRGWLRRSSTRGAIDGGAMSRATMSRSAFGGSKVFGRRSSRGASQPRLRPGRSGPARLHMPRPKAKRKWRSGGYR